MYNILAINPGHNGSVAFVSDGQLKYYCEEERLSRLKYDGNPFRGMISILETFLIDELVIGGTTVDYPSLPWTGEDPYSALARKFNPNIKITKTGNDHHIGHAAAAFYNSGFESAVAIVVDGSGSMNTENSQVSFETESIYGCNYPHRFTTLYKKYWSNDLNYSFNGVEERHDSVTIVKAYEAVSDYLGFGFIEAGKTMGLSPYGQADDKIHNFFIENLGNKNLLRPSYPAGAYIDENRFNYLTRKQDPKDWHQHPDRITTVDKNIAWKIQQETQELVGNLIEKAIDLSREKNIVISGGYGLNCVANYYYKKRFPNINLYVDPISHDGGTAIGLARLAWHVYSESKEKDSLTSLYLGFFPSYNNIDELVNTAGFKICDTTVDDISQLIVDQNIVAIFSGRAEGGPRALGNRSILFDPRNPKGKDIVNTVKGREWFRPFAGSILAEHADEWFEMAGLKDSPYMMYAIPVKEEKLPQIPAVAHVDGTCRIQTVNDSDNLHYRELIKSFYAKTGVPILFNTSFNLAGHPLVEIVKDAIDTMKNSDIRYLYLPEIKKLVYNH